MKIELNGNMYSVKKYKGEDIDVYYYHDVLYDDKPKHHDLLGVFDTENGEHVGVVDKTPIAVNMILSLIMLSISAVLFSISLSSIIAGNNFIAQVETIEEPDTPIRIEPDTEEEEDEDYTYVYYFNRRAHLYKGELTIDFEAEDSCKVTVVYDGQVLATNNIEASSTLSTITIGDIKGCVTLLVEFENVSYSNVITVCAPIEHTERVCVTVTPTDIKYKCVYPDANRIMNYGYNKDGKYVDAEITSIENVECIHIVSNCTVSKSYWDDDYHYPLVIGYTDSNAYNMILGNADKVNAPENVKIIDNMFSLSTVPVAYSNYFTYKENKGIVEIYVPLSELSSDKLPIDKGTLIVDSDNPITVQINSNIVQRGKDNIHALIMK